MLDADATMRRQGSRDRELNSAPSPSHRRRRKPGLDVRMAISHMLSGDGARSRTMARAVVCVCFGRKVNSRGRCDPHCLMSCRRIQPRVHSPAIEWGGGRNRHFLGGCFSFFLSFILLRVVWIGFHRQAGAARLVIILAEMPWRRGLTCCAS